MHSSDTKARKPARKPKRKPLYSAETQDGYCGYYLVARISEKDALATWDCKVRCLPQNHERDRQAKNDSSVCILF